MSGAHNCILPKDLLDHVEHNIWLRVNDDQSVDIGMTDIAQTMAGSMIHYIPKAVGMTPPRRWPGWFNRIGADFGVPGQGPMNDATAVTGMNCARSSSSAGTCLSWNP